MKATIFNSAIIGLLVLFFNLNLEAATPKSEKNMFASEEVLEMTLEMDMKAVIRDVSDKRDYHLANLVFTENGKEYNFEVKVKTRGHFRRQRSICKFPPLKMKFPKEGTENTMFEGQNKLKLVTHCSKKDLYEENILNEYLIYKMYNIITDKSFKVRLAKITYVDVKGKYEPVQKYSFFIEDADDMAERMGGKILKAKNVHPDKTNYDHMTLLSVYQYMIGNTDWSVATLHNIRLVTLDPWQAPYAVPYDFDWAGFVDAPYAVPSELLPIEDVTERLYRGYYRSTEQLQVVFDLFKQRKSEITGLIQNFPYHSEKVKNANLRYIEDFYKIISKEKAIEKEFIDNCRGGSKLANS